LGCKKEWRYVVVDEVEVEVEEEEEEEEKEAEHTSQAAKAFEAPSKIP
jgi:hypothetical protein